MIDVLPTKATGIECEWPTVRKTCRIRRSRRQKVNGIWQEPQEETVYLITSLTAAGVAERQPQSLGHRDYAQEQGLIPGEDGATNRSDNAPRNVFSLTGFVLKILKPVSPSPTRAIEHFQDHKNRAIRLFSDFH